MGYRISYEPIQKLRQAEKRRSAVAALTALFLLAFPFLAYAFWPEGWHLLRKFLLPGDPAVTAAALEELSLDLKSGSELSVALEGFCHTILEGAGFAAG